MNNFKPDIVITNNELSKKFIKNSCFIPFDDDWDLVLDTVRDRLKKKANRKIFAKAPNGEKRVYKVEGHPDVIKRLDLMLEAMNKMGEWGCSRGIVLSIDGDGPEFLYVEGTEYKLDKESFDKELNNEDVHIYHLESVDEINKKEAQVQFTADDLTRLYELEYKIDQLNRRKTEAGGWIEDTIQNKIWQWEEELRSLVYKGLEEFKKIFDKWIGLHSTSSWFIRKEDIPEEIEQMKNKELKELYEQYQKGEIDKPWYMVTQELNEKYMPAIADYMFSNLEPYVTIKNINEELKQYPVNDLGSNIAMFNIALNTVHKGGKMIDWWHGITEEDLNDLTAGKYIPEWDTELSKIANDPVKDTVNFQGIDIDIEWPSGSIRSYEGDDTYVTHMKVDYGYARGVEGNDGEELDIYLADRESTSPVAFIIEQLDDEGNYDEDKIVLGVESEGEAADIYLEHMPSYALGDIRKVPIEKLRNALYGKPEDRRGQEDLVPSEEKTAKRSSGFKYMANKQPGEKVGLFIPLPPELARQFPAEGKAGEDDSDPHITLLYIGEVPKERWDELTNIIKQSLSNISVFELSLLSPDIFTNDKGQQIIHSPVEISAGNIDLFKLHDILRKNIEDAGFEVKAYKEFTPHVTIEYVDPNEEPKFADVEPTGSWTVNNIEIWGLGDPISIELDKRIAMIQKIASYSDIAVEAIEKANINPLSILILQYVDPNAEYVDMVDQLVQAMLRDNNLKTQIEQLIGKHLGSNYSEEYNLKQIKDTLGENIIKSISYKIATKAWPQEDDIFENEFTDGTEDRENRDIPRPEEKERKIYRNT